MPRILTYGTVDSTMSVAEALCRDDALDAWDSVIAKRQTAGHGQHGRNWVSPEGNLHATLCLPPEHPFNTFAASPATAGLVAHALSALGFDIAIKWPNDILLRNASGHRKAGGIILKGCFNRIIAGIGINMKYAPMDSELRPQHAFPAGILPRDILLNAGITSPSELWSALVDVMRDAAADPDWKARTERFLLYKDEIIEIAEDTDSPATARGRFLGLDGNGCLLVDTDTGILTYSQGRARKPL